MNYSVDELFRYKTFGESEAYVWKYLKRDDPDITRVEIPTEFNGLPVVEITESAFANCKFLREVYIPDSVKLIEEWSFEYCPELREIRLPKHVEINPLAFDNCPKLLPEIVLAGLVGCPEDISKPFDCVSGDWNDILRPEVLELIIKYDSFRLIGTEMLFKQIVSRGLFSHFEMLENAGRSPTAEQTDALINLSAENGKTEMTAYLLEYKNRKFGFDGGDKFEL